MPPQLIFLLQLVLGYVACLLCFSVYVFPRLKKMDRVDAQRAIATLHSFRFFGLVFILPGIVGPTCRLASPRSPPTPTSRPECWPYSRYSR
jgi:hypothetical protein